MAIYFGFSDECGVYKKIRSDKHLKAHPFFVRCTLLLDAEEWKNLNDGFRKLKELYDIPIEEEIKWSDLWLVKRNETKKVSKKNSIPSFLKGYEYKDLYSFVESALGLLDTVKDKHVVITYTNNENCPSYDEIKVLEMHLMSHMQRIEMQIQTGVRKNLAVLFFDPVDSNTDTRLREVYHRIYNSGDFIKEYSHIKDSLNIEISHQSVGIQLADYVSGCFNSLAKGMHNEGFEDGKTLYFRYVHPVLRRYRNSIWGAGLVEVPTDYTIRNTMKQGYDNIHRKFRR